MLPHEARRPPSRCPMLAQLFNVGDQVPSSIVFQIRVRRALSRAALVKEHYAISFRVEIATVIRHHTSARSTVQKDNGLPFWIAALFVVQTMDRRDLQPTHFVGFNRA